MNEMRIGGMKRFFLSLTILLAVSATNSCGGFGATGGGEEEREGDLG